MTIHVTVETCQDIVKKARAFVSGESVLAAEKKWLQVMNIRNDACRQGKTDCGTAFLVFETELK